MVKLAENAGFGFDKIENNWNLYNNTNPEYDIAFDSTILKLYFVESKNKDISNNWNDEKKGLNSETVEETVEEMILIEMQKNPSITSNELQKITNMTRRGIEWNIKKLKLEGKIERVGSTKKGKWTII